MEMHNFWKNSLLSKCFALFEKLLKQKAAVYDLPFVQLVLISLSTSVEGWFSKPIAKFVSKTDIAEAIFNVMNSSFNKTPRDLKKQVFV